MLETTKPNRSHRLREFRQKQKVLLWGPVLRVGTYATMLRAMELWQCGLWNGLQEQIVTALGVKVADFWPEASHEQS
jgi:hypothetical protein